MIPKQELIKKIKFHFNLNIYESKVWLALLNKAIATVGEIAELSGVPRSRVYDVLQSLEKRGFAIPKLDKPIKYIAVKPAVVIDHMKNGVLKDAEEKAKSLSTIRDNKEYQELEILYNRGIKPLKPEELSSAIRGRQNIYSHLKELISGAEKEVTLVSTTSALKRKAKFLKPLFEQLKNKNINIRLAASHVDNLGNKEKIALMHLSKDLGVPIRKIKINSRFCIVDKSKLLIFVTPDSDEDSDIGIWINSPFFGRAFTAFLNPIWRTK